MEFYEFKTHWDKAHMDRSYMRSIVGDPRRLPNDPLTARFAFYWEGIAKFWNKHQKPRPATGGHDLHQTLYDSGNADLTTGMEFVSEVFWYENSCRYYKLWPEYINIFRQTRLDLPGKVFQPPGPAFVVLLPKGQQDLLMGSQPVRAIMLSAQTMPQFRDGFIRMCQRSGIPAEAITAMIEEHKKKTPACGRLVGLAVVCEPPPTHPDAWDMTLLHAFEIDDERLLQEQMTAHYDAVATAERLGPAAKSSRMTLLDAFRIMLSVSFLAVGQDRLIHPDVINADLQRYLEAVNARNEKRMGELHDRANRRRRGAEGYTVGRSELILGRRSKRQEETDVLAESLARGELTYQHQRGPHFHVFWTGQGRTTPTVKFINQLTVRADLPLNPDAKPKGQKVRAP